MPASPDLYALVIRLRPERGGPMPNALGHGAQALFLDLLRQVDPDLAAALHADAHSKPFTVAVLPQTTDDRRPTTDDVSFSGRRLSVVGRPPIELRVAFTRAEFFAPITRALLNQTAAPTLHLGRAALALADVFGTPDSHAWAGYSSFADLSAAVRVGSAITLEFATPAAVGQGTRADGRQRLALLPTPELIFSSIARRWNELAPPELRLDAAAIDAAAQDTLVSRYELATAQISLGKGPQKGFVGLCSYELPPDAEQARMLSLLADAVFYLGVGMKTARGMGLCRRTDERRTTNDERRTTTDERWIGDR